MNKRNSEGFLFLFFSFSLPAAFGRVQHIPGQIERGQFPAMLIGVPVGFVNVEEAKEQVLALCRRFEVPAILANLLSILDSYPFAFQFSKSTVLSSHLPR